MGAPPASQSLGLVVCGGAEVQLCVRPVREQGEPNRGNQVATGDTTGHAMTECTLKVWCLDPDTPCSWAPPAIYLPPYAADRAWRVPTPQPPPCTASTPPYLPTRAPTDHRPVWARCAVLGSFTWSQAPEASPPRRRTAL